MDFFDFALKIKKEEVDKNIIFTPQNSAADLLFDSIQMPPWQYLLTMEDLGSLHWIATSKSLAGNAEKRQQYLNEVMNKRGFKFMAGGTNRNVYRHLEIPHIVAKVPIDKVGMGDNLAEYRNQYKIWPYCAKTLQTTPGGIVGFAERLNPIVNRTQFVAYAQMVYMTTIEIVGKYVLEDIGEKYFKNWGVRRGMGCALVDYPYIFELDGSKLICKNTLLDGSICWGEIDYDPGFNELRCKKCNHYYHASDLQLLLNAHTIVKKKKKGGHKPMNVKFMKGNKCLAGDYSSDTIVRPSTPRPRVPAGSEMKVTFRKGNTILASTEVDVNPAEPEVKGDKETVGYSFNIGDAIVSQPPAPNQIETIEKPTEPAKAYNLNQWEDFIPPELLGDPSIAGMYREAMKAVGGLNVISGGQDENGIWLTLANGDNITVPWEKLQEAIGWTDPVVNTATTVSKDDAVFSAPVDDPTVATSPSYDSPDETVDLSKPPEEDEEEKPKELNPTRLNLPPDAFKNVDKAIEGDEFKTTPSDDILNQPGPAAIAVQKKEEEDEFPPNPWGPGASINRPTRRRVMTGGTETVTETKRTGDPYQGV